MPYELLARALSSHTHVAELKFTSALGNGSKLLLCLHNPLWSKRAGGSSNELMKMKEHENRLKKRGVDVAFFENHSLPNNLILRFRGSRNILENDCVQIIRRFRPENTYIDASFTRVKKVMHSVEREKLEGAFSEVQKAKTRRLAELGEERMAKIRAANEKIRPLLKDSIDRHGGAIE